MEKDSHHNNESQSEEPPRRRPRPSDRAAGPPSYQPSRLSQVTNSEDISDTDVGVDAQAEAIRNLSITIDPVPFAFDNIKKWEAQGGTMEELGDSRWAMLLDEYLAMTDNQSSESEYRPPEVVPPAAPMLEDEDEEDGGVLWDDGGESWDDGGESWDNVPSSPSRHKDKGKGRAR